MTFPEWSLIVCSVLSVGLAMGPSMIKVHAKLAVIASKIVDLCDKMDGANEEYRRLWEASSRHQSRHARCAAFAHRRTIEKGLMQGSATGARQGCRAPVFVTSPVGALEACTFAIVSKIFAA